ncbi:SMI1/KNR4 family protein [Clostridiales bacterium COT073_COT-073]|nr:SMI1/KNR4 family protein [Clostridiales bacterium COT073_COT-073]
MDRERMIARLQWYQQRVKELGGYTRELRIKEPATEAEVVEIEKQLGYSIPEDFRKILLEVSSHLEFFWSIYDEEKVILPLPDELSEIFRGDLHFGLDIIPVLEESRKDWIKICYSDYENPYDRLFYNKLAFYEVGNGDLIAIDLEKESYGDIVYLSHDGDEMHGYVLAHSFTELLEEWTKLGCVGGECWQFEAFTNRHETPIDSTCANAKLWLKTIGKADEQ